MNSIYRAFPALISLSLLLGACQTKKPVEKKPESLEINFAASLEKEEEKPKLTGINWDYENPQFLVAGAYPRLIGYKTNVLCFYENNGIINMLKGDRDAKEWGEPTEVARYKDGAAITPGALVLKNGDIICFYVESPLEDFKDYFRIMMTKSKDEGKSWSEPVKLFQAGNNFKAGCWEPSACQVKNGNIYLFFSNELPYGDTNQQEVTMLTSKDNGDKWSAPVKLFFKPTRRIGAPGVMTLDDDKGMLLVVDNGPEENTLEKQKPVMLFSTVEDQWERPLTKEAETFWDPFIRPLENETYAASPSISRLSTGETLMSLSYKDSERKEPGIAVFLGDKNGKFFTNKSEAFQLPSDVKAHWSSIFVLGGDRIVVAATTKIKDKEGIWLSFGEVEIK